LTSAPSGNFVPGGRMITPFLTFPVTLMLFIATNIPQKQDP
jgi:hypothetical protein